MKSMEDYINEVYAKYEESEKNNIEYKKVKMKYRSPLPTLCGIVTCLIILVVCVNLFNNENNNIPDPDKDKINFVTEEKEDGTKIYTEYLYTDDMSSEIMNRLISYSDCIALVSNINQEYCDFYIHKDRVVLRTIGTSKIENILKSNRNIENNNIEFFRYGGEISLLELEKEKDYDWKSWEITHFNKEIPEKQKEITYFKQIPEKGCEFEKDKQYLVFLKYDENENKYNIWNFVYGVMEYDPETNMVKNIDTGEFEEFNWELINQ